MTAFACNYASELRAVGQALETQGISNFELKTRTQRYFISGKPDQPSSIRALFRNWRSKPWRSEPCRLTYSRYDLELLSKHGLARRVAGERLPEFYSASNILRTVGAYLDAKKASLVELQKRATTLTLLYRAESGYPQMEDRTIASFYATFVKLYESRSRGPKT